MSLENATERSTVTAGPGEAATLGIDIGADGARAVVLTGQGRVIGRGQASYTSNRPAPGWVEQRPAVWLAGVQRAVRRALSTAGISTRRLVAIGLSGQMHSTVLLDAAHQPIGDAILGSDDRSADEAATIEARLGRQRLLALAGSRIVSGFTVASLAWLARQAVTRWVATRAVCLPKDYVRLTMTGELATEPSDAAGTGLYEISRGEWSTTLANAAGVPLDWLPPIIPSAAVSGHLRPVVASALGLPAGLPVVAGCADTAGLALATGVTEAGDCLIALGDGGMVLSALTAPRVDLDGRLHTFHHAQPDRWYLLGTTPSAGLALRWASEQLLGTTPADLMALAARAPAGADGLLFQPYLLGERAPHHESAARAALVGLQLCHGREHIARAVLEGVAFSLRATLELVIGVAGPAAPRLAVTGFGLDQPLWRQLIADVTGRSLWYWAETDLAAIGAARLAGVAVGHWSTAAASWPNEAPAATPVAERDALEAAYQRFRQLSPRLDQPPSPSTNGG